MISVVIPLYNKENTIVDTIHSVLNQSYTNFELIIVDDGSTDHSAKHVKSIVDERIKYFHKLNGGVSSARNEGVRRAIGEWILFLDADDILYTNALESLIAPINNYPEIDMVCGKFRYKRGEAFTDCSRSEFVGVISSNYKCLFFRKFQLVNGNYLIRKVVVQKYPFNEKLSRFEDLQSILEWLRCIKLYVVSEYIMYYNKDASSLSIPSKNIEKDFIYHLYFKHKSFWEKCKMGELIYLGLINYPDDRRVIFKKYYRYIIYVIIAKLNLILQ